VLPAFLERIRIVEGSLGMLILFASFAGTVAPIFGNTLQALKKFRETSLIHLLGAPLRLVTMLIAMPFRPLAGYFAGQAATPLFSCVAAVFALRREWTVPAEPYWSRDVVRRFGRLLLLFAISGTAGAVSSLVETTVLRQRLPEIDSAAYYMVTRFSDIAGFLYNTLVFTLFPFTAELASRGKDLRPLLLKASAATTVFCAAAALLFAFTGRTLLGLLPHGSAYADYWWAIPWIIGINALNYITSFYTTIEIAANRFGYMKFMVPLTLLYPAALLAVTGRGYFAGILPDRAMSALAALNVTTLNGMLWWMTAVTALKLAGVALHACRGSAMPADKHSGAENL
jgi:O-antigen/teichoic acid export membrane protein